MFHAPDVPYSFTCSPATATVVLQKWRCDDDDDDGDDDDDDDDDNFVSSPAESIYLTPLSYSGVTLMTLAPPDREYAG